VQEARVFELTSFEGLLAASWIQEKNVLWTLVAVFLILWLLGFSMSVGGSLIHVLLVVALVMVVVNLLNGRKGAA
jgi:hypothetical protein